MTRIDGGRVDWTSNSVDRRTRVTTNESRHKVFGVVLHEGTPLQSVEVKVDDGPWQPATMDPTTSEKHSWKFFTCDWHGATSGEHTVVSRVTDVKGHVQPTAKDLEVNKAFLERNAQYPRTVMIA